MASSELCREFLVGISRRIVMLIELGCLVLRMSNIEAFDPCRVGEGQEMVSGGGRHQEVVQLTIKVAMVIMALAVLLWGMPIAIVLGIFIFLKGRMSTSPTGIVPPGEQVHNV